MKLQLKFAKKVIATPVWNKIPRIVADLIDAGLYGPGNFFPYEDSHVFYALDDADTVVGFIVFYNAHMTEDWFIQMAHVRPEYRGRGIHSAIFNHVKSYAKKENGVSISSGTSVHNTEAQRAFERQGRKLVAYTYVYDIKDTDNIIEATEIEVAGEKLNAILA